MMANMKLTQKYQALLDEAQRRELPDVQNMRLCLQLLSVAADIDRDCAARLAPYGLSEERFVLLFLLDAASDGMAPNLLAARAGITRATVTGLLDGLEREALIERQADAHDRRALRIVLTRKGKRLAKQVFAQHSLWIASLLSGLSGAERKQLSALLGKLAQPLEAAA